MQNWFRFQVEKVDQQTDSASGGESIIDSAKAILEQSKNITMENSNITASDNHTIKQEQVPAAN